MSSTHAVSIVCDRCGLTDTNSTGSYTRIGWSRIRIECIEYVNTGYPSGRSEACTDFCPKCISATTRQEMIRLSSEKMEKK